MGFLRRLFGSKKQTNGSGSNKPVKENNKKKWNFSNTNRDNNSVPPPPSSTSLNHSDPSSSPLDANKHAIAVAAATAAVAEAALAAAHAAAEVVRLTSNNNNASGSRPATATATVHLSRRRLPEEIAAVKIQSTFRGYLARRALRALKALVKLQALVRGHIVRKQTADMLRRMQTLVRLQVQARATRVHSSDNMFKSSLSNYPVPEEYEHPFRAYSTKFDGSSILKRCSSNANFRNTNSERARFDSNWLDHWMEDNVCSQTGSTSLKNLHPDDENSDKILEVDTWKPHFKSHRGGSSSSSFQTSQHYYLSSDYNNNKNFMASESSPSKGSTNRALNQNLSSREGLQLSSLKFHKGKEEEEANSRTTDNSPQAFSASSRHGSGARRGTFTPTRSECSWGYFSGYAGYPNYMANTESSRAKVRSQSAPRQRLEFDRYGSTKGFVQSLWDVGPNNKSYKDSDLLRNTSRFNRNGSGNNYR